MFRRVEKDRVRSYKSWKLQRHAEAAMSPRIAEEYYGRSGLYPECRWAFNVIAAQLIWC